MTIEFSKSRDHLERLPALAKRLGVAPGDKGGVTLHVQTTGESYDFFDLIAAVLDRLDRATP